jgi:hypothetical protein
MGAPISFLSPRLQFDAEKLDFLFLELKEQNNLIEAGVKVEGDAAAYALVWEWGNARQTKIGPKTTLGVNPDGKKVFLSIQAPTGYIRVNTPLFMAALKDELAKVRFASTSTGAVTKQLELAAKRTAARMVDIIREHVPVDTGQLHDDIKVVNPGDTLLDQGEEDNALFLNEE